MQRGCVQGAQAPFSMGRYSPPLLFLAGAGPASAQKPGRQASSVHRAPVRALRRLRRLAACRQRAAAGAVLRSGGGDQRAGADVLPRGHKAGKQAEAARGRSDVASICSVNPN